MQPDDSTASPTPRGGFVSRRQHQAAEAVFAAQEAKEASLSIELTEPDDEQSKAGVVVHFMHQTNDSVIKGDVSRGPAGLTITRVEVSAPLPAGVTQRLLRTAPLSEVLAAVRADATYEDARRQATRAIFGEEAAPGIYAQDDAVIPQTAGRTPMTDDLLRKVSLAYLEETGPGKDRRAIQRLAARFGRPEGTVRTWVGRARQEGWLGPGAKGRMGAEPGPKLIRWSGDVIREAEPAQKEANRIARELGATTRGQVSAAVAAYGGDSERAITKQIGVHPLVACLAAEILFGRTASAELAERSGRRGISEELALEEIGGEIRQLITGKGITVDESQL